MDNHTPGQRRRNMQAVKNKNSQIELLLRKELWRRGMRYRKNVKSVYGHPDLAFIRLRIAVFVDSEFWHGFDWEHRKEDIKSNRDFWIPKIERNIRRDAQVTEELKTENWAVIRVWGNEIKNNVIGVADRIEQVYKEKENAIKNN